jgi:hypothetical protein
MAILDKALAEEKAEFTAEVNVLRGKVNEITVDLEIFRREVGLYRTYSRFLGLSCRIRFLSASVFFTDPANSRVKDGEGGEGAPTTVEIIQLERQSERLKEALNSVGFKL